jgi:hypothetical protein
LSVAWLFENDDLVNVICIKIRDNIC